MKKHITIIFLFFFLNLNAQVWNKLGNGFSPSTIYALKKIDSILYIGGSFRIDGINNLRSFAFWNGVSLDTLPTNYRPQTGYPLSMIKFNDKIIVGGHFKKIAQTSFQNGILNTNGIASWDGSNWASLGGGIQPNGGVASLCIYNGDLYVAGSFSTVGSGLTNLKCIVRWDGTEWHPVGTGVVSDFSMIRAMAVYNDKLYIGGTFSKAGDIPAFNVAGWDGTQYFDLDTGVLGDVHSLIVDSINNFLYVGGSIYHAGGNNGFFLPNYVIKWDGYGWATIGINPEVNSGGNGIIMYNNQLYAGNWGSSGQIQDTILTRFDGYQWHRVEGPFSTIYSMEVFNNELYVASRIIVNTGDTAWGAARYYAPPDTASCLFIQPYIRAMPFGTKDVGDTIKTTPPYHIQFYTNNKYASSWAWDFGDGNTANIREPAHTYAAPGTYNVTLEVIHPHNLSSQVCTLNVNKTITIVDVTDIEEPESKQTEYLGQNIPNPFSNTTVIPYYVPQGSAGFLQIHSTKGALINEYALQQGHNSLEISMGSYKAGVYLYSIVIDNERKQTKRMVVE